MPDTIHGPPPITLCISPMLASQLLPPGCAFGVVVGQSGHFDIWCDIAHLLNMQSLQPHQLIAMLHDMGGYDVEPVRDVIWLQSTNGFIQHAADGSLSCHSMAEHLLTLSADLGMLSECDRSLVMRHTLILRAMHIIESLMLEYQPLAAVMTFR